MTKTSGMSKILFIILGVIYIIAGIYAIFNPLAVDVFIPIMLGSLLLIYGIFSAISYFLRSKNKSIWQLVLAIITIILGLLILGNDLFGLFAITYFIAYMTGAALIAIGVIKSVSSFEYKKMGMNYWWSVLVLGIADVLVGLLIFIYPLSLAIYLGCGLIADGISDLMIAFTVMDDKAKA